MEVQRSSSISDEELKKIARIHAGMYPNRLNLP
jgi:hypothetical protein